MSLGPQDLRVGTSYELARGEARALAIELRRRRRVDLGDLLSLVFENRETLLAAAEESLRAERIEEPERVAGEAAGFRALLPPPGTLAASLYLEVTDAADLPPLLEELEAIAEGVHLEIDGTRAQAAVLPLGAGGDRTAPAAYLLFTLTDSQREAWREGARVRLGVVHPRCSAITELSDEQRAAIAADLVSGDHR